MVEPLVRLLNQKVN